MPRTITRMMNKYEEEFEKELTCIHSRSNFNMLLNRISVESNKAERNQLVSRLKKMLRDSDIEYDNDLFTEDKYIMSDIEEFQYIQKLLKEQSLRKKLCIEIFNIFRFRRTIRI